MQLSGRAGLKTTNLQSLFLELLNVLTFTYHSVFMKKISRWILVVLAAVVFLAVYKERLTWEEGEGVVGRRHGGAGIIHPGDRHGNISGHGLVQYIDILFVKILNFCIKF